LCQKCHDVLFSNATWRMSLDRGEDVVHCLLIWKDDNEQFGCVRQ